MILSENEAKNLLTKILSNSKAESASASLTGTNGYNLRFALNSLSTNGYTDGLTLYYSSNFGKKTGTVSTNKFDDDSIKEIVKKSEEIARFSPENKEFMPLLPQQEYPASLNFSAVTENLSTDTRSDKILYILEQSKKNNVISAGYSEDETGFFAVMNTNGLFAYNKNTMSRLSATVRTADGTGSGKFQKIYCDDNKIEHKKLADWVIERSKLSVKPAEIKPGRYTVILEPSAVADMVSRCINFMSARGADEGRSFFSKSGGGNKIGDQLVNDSVNIYSDPLDINAPSMPFSWDGEPRVNTVWFENGVLKNLFRNRFWAEKTAQPSVPYPSNVIMQGTEKTLDEMISSTDEGILVTRFWYIRTVDPGTMLLTGLTRDGVFEIKNGRIAGPVKNFRFNESPVNMLNSILETGKSEKASGSETDDFPIFVPPLKIKDFNFSSLSDAI